MAESHGLSASLDFAVRVASSAIRRDGNLCASVERTNSPCGLETVLSNTWPAAAAAGGRSSAPFDNVTMPSPSLRY